MSLIEKFMPLVLEKEEEGTQTPTCVHQDVTFVNIKYNNLYRILSIPYRSMHVCEFIHGQKMGNSVLIWTAHVNFLNASVERYKLQ